MSIEVTTEGVQKLSGLPNSVSTQKLTKVNAAKFMSERQDLPPQPQEKDLFNIVQEIEPGDDTIEKTVETLNSQVQNLQRDLHFSVDEESGRTIIRVIDRETRETIRTIPPEEISVMAQSLERHSGVLFNTSV